MEQGKIVTRYTVEAVPSALTDDDHEGRYFCTVRRRLEGDETPFTLAATT